MYQIKSQSVKELQKIKKIINLIITLLENNITLIKDGNIKLEESQKELLNFLIGNKENVVSIISKLSNLLLKFGMLEDKNKDENNSYCNIDEVDLKIIKKYLSQYNNKK